MTKKNESISVVKKVSTVNIFLFGSWIIKVDWYTLT